MTAAELQAEALSRAANLESARTIIERLEREIAGVRTLSPNRRAAIRYTAGSRKLARVRRYLGQQQRLEV
jgi:hypothetical protein